MDTWWIDDPLLLGSRNPTTADIEQLRKDGFTVVVSLLREDQQSPAYDLERAQDLGFTRHNIPVEDFHPPTVSQLNEFVGLIDQMPTGTKVAVHCQGGTGRTGTFAAAYWITRGMAVSAALSHVRKTRPHAVETRQQEAALREFALQRNS